MLVFWDDETGILRFWRLGTKKKKSNDSHSSEKGNNVTNVLTPTVMDFSKQVVEFPSLDTLNGKPADGITLDLYKPCNNSLGVSNLYANVTSKPSRNSMNFRTLFTPVGNGVGVVVPIESIRAISEWFANTTYGFFLRKRVAYPVDANYVRNTWVKYGLNPDVNLLKEDIENVPVWVKLHGVPVTAFSENGLSAIATKLGTPLMLDSYISDICLHSWGMSSYVRAMIELRSSYARAMIELRADVELKDTIVVAMSKLVGESNSTTAIVDKIGKLEKLIINGKVNLVDDEGEPVKK
ncbi:high affinity nitrate transporter 2.4-like protein, partial [Tanacetum coccineum]